MQSEFRAVFLSSDTRGRSDPGDRGRTWQRPRARAPGAVPRTPRPGAVISSPKGGAPGPDDYKARFPDYAAQIDESFGGSRFSILRFHAEGGMGEVYVAYDQELRREVALKQIKERHAGNLHSRMRFEREAETTGRMQHPGIVPI